MTDENDGAVVEPTGNKKPRTHGELAWATGIPGMWNALVDQPRFADQAEARKWLADELAAGTVDCQPLTLLRVVATVNPSLKIVQKAVL